jgi:hypothetical protein
VEKENAAERDDSAASGCGILLGREAVRAISVAAFEGLNRRPHLLADRSAQETTHRVWLPAGKLRELFQSDAAGAFQQVEDLCPFCCRRGRRWRASSRSRPAGAGSAFGGAVLALRLATRAFVVTVSFLFFFLEVRVILSVFLLAAVAA